jgi:hypothetical protein
VIIHLSLSSIEHRETPPASPERLAMAGRQQPGNATRWSQSKITQTVSILIFQNRKLISDQSLTPDTFTFMPRSIIRAVLRCLYFILAVALASAQNLKAEERDTSSDPVIRRQEPFIFSPDVYRRDDMVLPPSHFLRPYQVNYYVDDNAGEARNGSPEHPFRTIRQALDMASEKQALKVQLFISPGIYPENLQITRSTKIEGHGSESIIQGSIQNTSFDLTLINIKISYAVDRAIRQEGGRLYLLNCSIFHTKRLEGQPASGRAIELSGGAVAEIQKVFIAYNEGQAILLKDPDTLVTGREVTVRHNRVHPEAYEQAVANNETRQVGAIEVLNAAKLLLENFTVEHNDYAGVLVHDGGQAHLRQGRIGYTFRFKESSSGRYHGGVNLGLFRGATAEFHHSVTRNAESAGVIIKNSYLTSSHMEIRNNPIGVSCVPVPESGYDFYECCTDILMEGNLINFDGVALSVPDLSDTIDEDGASDQNNSEDAHCPPVPWE